jgi:DNA polymerase (family 10)
MAKHEFSNAQIAKLLEQVAAALALLNTNNFEIRAYKNAADSIEHADSEISTLWAENRLGDVPGIGKSMQAYISELFETGKVKHFESVMKKFPDIVYELIELPGIGPKTAKEIADLGVKDLKELEKQLKNGKLVEKGFSKKIAEKVQLGLDSRLRGNDSDRSRMLLPLAIVESEKILEYLRKSPDVIQADPLGSLRRRVVTIGDLDFSACTKKTDEVIEYFLKMPGVSRILSRGERMVMVVLTSGLHVDLLVGEPGNYGALLHHFTGGKNHNIHLRNIALEKGYSISTDGVKLVKTDEVMHIREERDIYKLLGMQMIPPEMREDLGEIELAIKHEIPKLVELKDIKGDFHLHSNFDINQSHGPGLTTLAEIVKNAEKIGYEYIALSDHAPAFKINDAKRISELVAKRTSEIEKIKKNTKNIRVLNSLEVDILPDGTLSVPDESLKTLDICNIGVHSSHQMDKDKMTMRILKALENQYAKILVHPTGRRLLSRPSYDADWEQIFEYCAKNNKALEVNGTPDRLDLRDDLIRIAKEKGCMFVINTDAHDLEQMENMKFGVDLARRGWLESKQVINTWEWEKVKKFFDIKD